MCEILKIRVAIGSSTLADEEEDAPLKSGMRDFLHLLPGSKGIEINKAQIEESVPTGMIREVLTKCKEGGMTKKEFDDAFKAVCKIKQDKLNYDAFEEDSAWSRYTKIKKLAFLLKTSAPDTEAINEIGLHVDESTDFENKSRNWSRYYLQGNQMRINNMRHFIWLAKKAGWLDKRTEPSDPHPSKWDWKSPRPKWMEKSLKVWTYCERSSEVDIFMGRIDAIEACIALFKSDRQISLDSVRDYCCFEQAFRRTYDPILGAASVSQKLRRARGDKTLKQRFDSSSDAQNALIVFLLASDDENKLNVDKEIAKDKKVYREILKEKREKRE